MSSVVAIGMFLTGVQASAVVAARCDNLFRPTKTNTLTVPGLSTYAMKVKMTDGRTIEVDVHVRRGKGNKPAVVLIPGLDDRAETWHPVLASMAQKPTGSDRPDISDRTMIALSLRGQGRTAMDELATQGPFPTEIPYRDQLTIIDSVLTTLRIKQAHLVGHSYGGGMALAFLAEAKSKVDIQSATLIAPYVSHFERYAKSGWMDPKVISTYMLETLSPFAFEASAAVGLPTFYEMARRDGHLSKLSDWSDNQRVHGLASMTMGVLKVNTQMAAQSLEGRDLIVNILAAGKDGLVPNEAHVALYSQIPTDVRGDLLIRGNLGHRATEQNPDGVAFWLSLKVVEAEARRRGR